MLGKRKNAIATLVTAGMLIACTAVKADTVHNQSVVDTNAFGWDSVGGARDTQQIADDFKPTIDGTIGILHWTGKYHDSVTSSAKKFEIRIFSDVAGKPDKLIFSQELVTAGKDTGGKDSGDDKLLSYTAPLAGTPILQSDSTYWLSIREIDSSTLSVWSWSFHKDDVVGGYSYRRSETHSWSVGTIDMAYSMSLDPLN